jgi:AraC-like DNA-binding protein
VGPDKLELLRLRLEAAVAGQLLLFAAFLFAGESRRSSAGLALGGFCGGLGVITAVNLLRSGGDVAWLRELNLLVELCLPPLALFHLRQVRRPWGPARPIDMLHAAGPAALFGAFKLGLLPNMDPAVVAWFLGHALAMAWIVLRDPSALQPAILRRFELLLSATLAAIGLMRLLIALDVAHGAAWRQDWAYLAVLACVALLSCSILYVGLRWPRLLVQPASHIRYVTTDLEPAELDRLQRAFDELMARERPYLDARLTLGQIAARLGTHERRLSQMVNTRHGMNLSAHLNRLRVEAAARMLEATDAPQVTTVMYDSGFGSKSAFQREFRRRFGMAAAQYRARAARRRTT